MLPRAIDVPAPLLRLPGWCWCSCESRRSVPLPPAACGGASPPGVLCPRPCAWWLVVLSDVAVRRRARDASVEPCGTPRLWLRWGRSVDELLRPYVPLAPAASSSAHRGSGACQGRQREPMRARAPQCERRNDHRSPESYEEPCVDRCWLALLGAAGAGRGMGPMTSIMGQLGMKRATTTAADEGASAACRATAGSVGTSPARGRAHRPP